MSRGYNIARAILAPLWRRAFAVEVAGTIPAGPCIVVANHQSVVDHFVMACVTNRPMANVAHREAFGHWAAGPFLRFVGCIPIVRQGGDEAALNQASKTLEAGTIVCLYPEGDWSPDGKCYKFHTGAARLAAATGAPIVPIALQGTFALRKGTGFKMGGPTKATVLEPVFVSQNDDVRIVMDNVQTRIVAITGQEITREYSHDRQEEAHTH